MKMLEPINISDDELGKLVATHKSFSQIFRTLGIGYGSKRSKILIERIKTLFPLDHFYKIPGKIKHPTLTPAKLAAIDDAKFAELIRTTATPDEFCVAIGMPEKTLRAMAAISERAARQGLDMSHYKITHEGNHLRRNIRAYLVQGSKMFPGGISVLTKALTRAKILPEECSRCHQGPEWRGRKLSLRAHFINGDATDWRIENLMIACPNCSSQLNSDRLVTQILKNHVSRKHKRANGAAKAK